MADNAPLSDTVLQCLSSEFAKKTFGEVFTPMSLVNEMLDKLPVEVWSNPDLKWVDPAMGSGNFIVRVVKRLMKGLAEVMPDAVERKRHIMTKMVYGVELQESNVMLAWLRLDPDNQFDIEKHFVCADSLAFDFWGMKFDVVVGNPPYQDPHNKNKAHPLWVKFFDKMFSDVLKESASILFVTPDSWRTKNSGALVYFATYDVEYISFDVKQHFPQIGSTFCWSFLRKSKTPNMVTSIVKDGKEFIVSMKGIDFLPDIESIDIIRKIMSGKNKLEVIGIGAPFRSDSVANVNLEFDNEFQYKLFHTNRESYYSIKKHPNFDDQKVIINKTGKWNPFYDNGSMGFTHLNFAVIVDDENSGIIMQQYLNSKLIRYFIGAMNVFGARDKYTIENIPMVPDASKPFTDEDLYAHFGLTPEEIALIESVVQ